MNSKKGMAVKMSRNTVVHPIPPTFDKHSRILILGSFPSVKSRESGYFYGHPRNRFWKVLSAVFEDAEPKTNEEKKRFLLKNRVALWDVIASCEIDGSDDASIVSAQPNDLCPLFEKTKIQKIFVNGKTAKKLYDRLIFPKIGLPAVYLPSTSPANAAWTTKKLTDAWRVILKEQ